MGLAWIPTEGNSRNTQASPPPTSGGQPKRHALPPENAHRPVEAAGAEDDGQVGAPVELDDDFGRRHFDGRGHGDEVPEDLARLRACVAPHRAGQEPVEPAGDNEQRHIEVDLEAHF